MAITCPKCGHQYDSTLFVFGQSVQCDCGTTFDISQGKVQTTTRPVRGLLVDIAGVLYVDDEAVPGAAAAVKRLHESTLSFRFISNTTRSTANQMLSKLERMGFEIEAGSLFTAPIATRNYIQKHGLRPYLLVHPNLLEEFSDVDCQQPNAVIVGDAAEQLHYQSLNKAFRILMEGGQLIGMGHNRYFREADGLSLDMGPFVEALSFASGVAPIIIGKPSVSFFQQALDDLDVIASQAVMIGDDLENDIGGAQSCGMRGILVRTGKYRPADEHHESVKPDFVSNSLVDATSRVLAWSTE